MFNKLTPTILIISVLVGCAKERSYDEVYKKPEQLKKSDIKTTKTITEKVMGLDGKEKTVTKTVPVKYLYVPMTMGTPRAVVEAAPFYQGKEKVVRLEWTKDGLDVLEIETDERFSDNEMNELPVLTLPGDYLAYQCAEDEFGDCTNKEEKDEEREWDTKDYFFPKYEKMEIKEVNFLNAVNDVEANGCATLKTTRVVDYEISDGVVNVELEKTYQINNKWRCIRNNFDFTNYEVKNSSFNMRYFFSIVELDKLATPGYQPINYPTPDHDEFGFFKGENLILNDNFDSQREEKQIFMNRWSPKRKNNELVYYLSKNYTKPENKALLDATKRVGEVINRGFSDAKVPFRIKFVEQDYRKKTEVKTGDLRYNTLVLIEDPLANGLLGYGPSVANPYTGEIVQAHTNMYGGVLTSTVRRVYQAAVDLTIERAKGEPQLLEGYTVAKSALTQLPETIAAEVATEKEEEQTEAPTSPEAAVALESLRNFNAIKDVKIDLKQVSFPAHTEAQMAQNLARFSEAHMEKVLKHRMAEKVNKRAQAMFDEHALDGFSKLDQEVFKMLDKKHGKPFLHEHTVEEFPIAGITKVIYNRIEEIEGIKNADGTLKEFDELNSVQKEKVKTVILVQSYTSTLIHEFGHNLGLRHNFSGSTDVENFYSKEEAARYGMTHRATYSSIMDYAFSDFNELKAFGKYDLAALKFAYARKVDLANGGEVDVKGSLTELDKELSSKGLSRKSFAYCTDENAGLSSLCNRFDEGTTLTEIAKYRIKLYKDMYKYRNFRDGRLDYSAYDTLNYAYWRKYELGQIRDIIEEFEFFAGIFGMQTMSNGCTPEQVQQYPICKRINDYRDAVKIVGDFFIEILKTPDHICAIANKDKPNVIVEYKKLVDIYDDVKYNMESNDVIKSCFNDEVTKHIDSESQNTKIVVGENGKFLNGIKDTNPNYKYVTDRAVLGTWPDKVFAMEALFKRRWRNRTTDSNQMALIDVPAIQEKAIGVLAHYAAGNPLAEPLPFTTKKGAKFTVPYVIGNEYKIEQMEDVFNWVKGEFGMDKSGQNSLIKVAFNRIEKVGVSVGTENSENAHSAANLVSINKMSAFTPINQIQGHTYWFDGIDRIFHSSDKMPIANVMLSSIVEKNYLDTVEPTLLLEVFTRRTNPTAPEDLSDNHKVFFGLAPGLHTQLIDLSNQGAQVPVEAFINALGPENGPIVFEVYNEGAAVMQSIVARKQQIMNTPRNPGEARLFAMPVDIIVQYISGSLTDNLVDFYKVQIQKLPMYQSQEDLRRPVVVQPRRTVFGN